ncbi:hypothetical protein WMY93_003737 [Mugilogobius chulae]|uniref:Uncharacterized protein n=1 Tax=Mugilogobius chulae TaxID=88201 RepID=A0AAW0Q3B4_9GOBI
MEEKESRRKLQDSLTEKEEIVLSLEAAVAKFETERKEMQLDFESVEEAVMIFKQSAEEKIKHLSQKLDMKESQTQQLQQKNDSLQKEVQSLTEVYKLLQEETVKQAEDKNEEVQSLKTTCTTSEEAEVIVEKEVEQEEVEGLKNAQSVSVSETEQETTTSTEWQEQRKNKLRKRNTKRNTKPTQPHEIDLNIRALGEQIRQAEEARLGASCLEKNKKNQEEEVQRKKKMRTSANQKKTRNKRHRRRPNQPRQNQTTTENVHPKIETG